MISFPAIEREEEWPGLNPNGEKHGRWAIQQDAKIIEAILDPKRPFLAAIVGSLFDHRLAFRPIRCSTFSVRLYPRRIEDSAYRV